MSYSLLVLTFDPAALNPVLSVHVAGVQQLQSLHKRHSVHLPMTVGGYKVKKKTKTDAFKPDLMDRLPW